VRQEKDDGRPPGSLGGPRASAPIEVPEDIVERIRTLCLVLPEVTDWEEIGELVTESYRILAPKKLTALLD
jgi:hypothetical protein